MASSDMELIRPQWSVPSQIKSFVTTRKGGVSKPPYDSLNLGAHVGDSSIDVAVNRSLLKAHLPSEPIWLQQVHGTLVSTPSNRLLVADAIVTDRVNEVLAIMTADCLPILFSNSRGTAIGAAHAGWRGLCTGVLERTVDELRKLSACDDEEEIVAWLGPAIGPTAFEVGQDVVDAFVDYEMQLPSGAFQSIASKPGKFLADLYLLAKTRLSRMGIHQIFGGEFCTVQQEDQFFSYRRDGETGRFASLIWIASPQ